MAEYTDFFSIMIQTSAGILGIIIAVIAVIHSLNVQARTPRTRELFDNILDLSQEYRGPFQDISLNLSAKLQNGLYQEMSDDFSRCEEIIEAPEDHNKSEILQAHVYRIEHYLSSSNLRDYHILSADQLDGLTDSAEWLISNVARSGDADEIYQEITGHNPGRSYMMDDILPQSTRLESWLKDNSLTISDKSLEAYFSLFQGFATDAIPEIQKGRQETLIDYDSPLRPVIAATTILLMFGIFVPSLFFLTPTKPIISLSHNRIFQIQSVILLVVMGTSSYLLYTIWDNIRS